MVSLKQENQTKDSPRQASPTKYVIKFLLVWLLALPVIAAVALLSDINWTKPFAEKYMGEFIGREIKLGQLGWHLGFSGVEVETDEIEINELTGENFLVADKSSVGLSVLPLLSGKLVIKHIDFISPTIKAVKLGPNKWNFDDLIIEGPEIRLVNVRDGTIKISDQSETSKHKTPFEISNLRMTFNWPRKKRRLPFYLSIEKQNKEFKSGITIEGYGTGEIETWPDNLYSFKVKGTNIAPRDVERLVGFLDLEKEQSEKVKLAEQLNMDGLVNFIVEAEGTFEEGLNATINGEVVKLAVSNDTVGDIKAGHAKGSMNLLVSDDKLSWEKLTVNLKGLTIQSSGQLNEWQKDDSKVSAQIEGKVHNVKDINYLLDGITKQTQKNEILSQFNPSKVTGKATLTFKLNGTTNNTKILTKIETDKLLFGDVIKDAQSQMPLLYIFGVTPQTKISGNIKMEDQERIELVQGKVSSPTADIIANGWMNLNKAVGKLDLRADSISLKETGFNIKQHRKQISTKPGFFEIGKKYQVSMSGKASARSTINVRGNGFNMTGNIKLNNAGMSLPQEVLDLKKLNGTTEFKFNQMGGRIKVPLITGYMGDGKFELKGNIIAKKEPIIDLTLHATHFDLSHLSGLMNLFQFELPILTERHLYGSVKDVVLRLSGTPSTPEIFFSAIPDDLYYKPPGLEKPLRTTAGEIVYDNDELVLKDVEMVSGGNTIITSVSIENVSTEARLTRVKAKSEGIDLADIHYYLSSPVMPPPLQNAYKDVLSEYKLTNPRGKAYGDILCLIEEDGEVTFDGLIGCFKVGVDFYNFPITNIAGILACSGDDLLLRDMHGNIRASRISLDGFIKKYRSKNPNWKAELTAKLHPKEIVQVMPNIEDQLQAGSIEVHSKGPLTFRSKIKGSFKKNNIQFALAADKNDRLTINSRIGKIYQPEGLPLTLDGSVVIEKHNLKIDNTHLLLGDTLVTFAGDVGLVENPAYKKKRKKRGEIKIFPYKTGSIDLFVDFPQEASIKTLTSLISPDLANDISGVLKGKLRAQGVLPRPDLSGKVEFSKVQLPELGIDRLDGHIRGERQKVDGQNTTACKIVVYDTEVKNIVIRNLSADLLAIPDRKTNSLGRLVLRNGHATMAGGTIRLDGYTDLKKHKHYLKAKMSDVSARKLSQRLLGDAKEITGEMHGEVELTTSGESNEQLVKHLQGKGKVRIEDGVVGRFGTLQTRLTQYNLLTQGIFGFNMNNLLQSVWPVRTGEFTQLTNEFSIAKGNLSIDHLRYTGDDMRLWGSGHANLPNNDLKVEIAGKIPRVAKSMLGGTFGTVSRKMTLQRAMHFVTFGKLENLPSLPLIGSIASDKPRTFTFVITAPLDNPDVIAKSIMKTFKWLPNKPAATAHPVPGIN